MGNNKTPQQRQFEQVVDKLRSQLAAMEETLKMMPKKGNLAKDCQREAINYTLRLLDININDITLEDFTPNEYSGNFELMAEIESPKSNQTNLTLLGIEFGYKQCEKGESIQQAFLNYHQLEK